LTSEQFVLCRLLRAGLLTGAGVAAAFGQTAAATQGFAGAGFPTDDPFVAEESLLPILTGITRDFEFEFATNHVQVSTPHGPKLEGFDMGGWPRKPCFL
jgi:hypothetical protein